MPRHRHRDHAALAEAFAKHAIAFLRARPARPPRRSLLDRVIGVALWVADHV